MPDFTDPLNRFRLKDKVALVTGGSRGLGKEMAQAFAAVGADVVIVSRKIENCVEVAKKIESETGRQAMAYSCHVGDWKQIDDMVEAVYQRFGRIDVLVNNAGMSPLYENLVDHSEALYNKVFEVNLKGPFRLMANVGTRMAGPFLTDIADAWDLEAVKKSMKNTWALQRPGEPDEVIGAALYLASDASSWTSGTILAVDGGMP